MMNIQIFGIKKCNDTKKAERFFKGEGRPGDVSFAPTGAKRRPWHYRCHPKIIDFCNKKFYNNELLIMTKDNGEEDVLKAIRTVEGNHARGRENQREVDSIQQEILSGLDTDYKEIGIISPYRDQVRLLKRTFTGIECDTVHKFQGREKDTIIISTVDNKITEFSDAPNLMNVVLSEGGGVQVCDESGYSFGFLEEDVKKVTKVSA